MDAETHLLGVLHADACQIRFIKFARDNVAHSDNVGTHHLHAHLSTIRGGEDDASAVGGVCAYYIIAICGKGQGRE